MNTQKNLKLLKAFRVDENSVRVLYYHTEMRFEFLISWDNVHAGSGEIGQYHLQQNCLSPSESFNSRITLAIDIGEVDENSDLDLYLEIRDTFNHADCADLFDPDHTVNRHPFIIEMKDEGFTNRQILDALEDGAVLGLHGISQDEAENMHSYFMEIS